MLACIPRRASSFVRTVGSRLVNVIMYSVVFQSKNKAMEQCFCSWRHWVANVMVSNLVECEVLTTIGIVGWAVVVVKEFDEAGLPNHDA